MYRDPDQPSIFARPEESDRESGSPRAPASLLGRPPDAVSRPIRPPDAPPARPANPRSQERPEGMSRQVIVLGSMGLAIIALAGFIAASVLRSPVAEPELAGATASEAPTATASASDVAEPSATRAPTATAITTATAAPTPAPTPAGPPEELAIGGWATVGVDELNVRRQAGLTATSLYRLVRGAVVHVFEGPISGDGLSWYRIASLGGAQGWAASGPQAGPFLTTFVAETDLLYCEQVTSEVLRIVDGSVRARDPIRVGELALPAAAFDDRELAVLELARATRSDACFGAQIIPVGVPTMYTQTYASACGRVTGDGAAFRLRPVAGMDVGIESQVKDAAILHPGLLAADANVGGRIRLAAMGDDVTLCVHSGVTEKVNGVDSHVSLDGMQCVVVDEHTADHLTIRSATGGDAIRFATTPEQPIPPGAVSVGSPVALSISAWTNGVEGSVSVWQAEMAGCG